jgi:hypothetical protein
LTEPTPIPVADPLEAISPRVSRVLFRGELLEVGPLTVDQLPHIIRSARPVVDAVLEMGDVAEAELLDFALGLIENHTPALTEAVAIAIGRPREFVGKAPLEDFTRLSLEVFEVNRDFFVQTLGPRLARAWAGKRIKATGDGPTASRP